MKKLTILCDMDGIITDLLTKWLNRYNDDHDDDLTIADIKTWNVSDAVKPEVGDEIYKYIEEPDFFEDLAPIPGAIKALSLFNAEGHDVRIATAHADNPNCAAAKIRWVQEHLGFSRKQVILIHPKHMLKGDVFIDDTPKKLKAYKDAWPDAKTVTIAYPYNGESKKYVDLYAEAWNKPRHAWKDITQYIQQLAEQ